MKLNSISSPISQPGMAGPATAAFAEQTLGIKPATTFHEDVEADRLPDKLTSPMMECRPS
jgi:hypothetical protein